MESYLQDNEVKKREARKSFFVCKLDFFPGLLWATKVERGCGLERIEAVRKLRLR